VTSSVHKARQLDRLLVAITLPHVKLGIIPTGADYEVPTNNFIMYDDKVVHVETVSAELTIKQPREVALYGKVLPPPWNNDVAGERQGCFVAT
jgi:hypothetical protein